MCPKPRIENKKKRVPESELIQYAYMYAAN